MLYVLVISSGHVVTLPPTLGCHGTQHVIHKYNQPSNPKRLIGKDDLTKPLFLGRLRLERIISNQMVGQ